MKLLIIGGNTINKGAHLMLVSISIALQKKYPNAELYLSPTVVVTKDILDLGLKKMKHPLFLFSSSSRLFNMSINNPFMTKVILKFKYKTTYPKGTSRLEDMDAVIDISGFAFGDKWGATPLINLKLLGNYLKKKKIPLILLPQALGPYTGKLQPIAKKAFDSVSLVFARDSVSYKNAKELNSNCRILQNHDITLNVKPLKYEKLINQEYVVIVPNERMLDKGSSSWKKHYVEYLDKSIKIILEESSLHICLLAHCIKRSGDYTLVEEIFKKYSSESRVSKHHDEDPLVLKSWLGSAEIVIGSRFHALASSLSSNVPCIGTSWNHKYEELFKDFGLDRFSYNEATDHFFDGIRELLDLETRKRLVEVLKNKNKKMSSDNEFMWNEITSILSTENK